MRKVWMVVAILGTGLAGATPVKLNCDVAWTRQVGAGGVPGQPPAELATIQIFRTSAGGRIDFQKGYLFLQQVNGVVLFNGAINYQSYGGNQGTFQALYLRGDFAGSFLLGVARNRDVRISLQPPPQNLATYTVRCQIL